MVRQRAGGDCGIAALATYLGQTYEDVYVAVAAIDRRYRGKNGLHNRELVAAARRLGVTLEASRAYDLDDDEGVLRVRWADRTKGWGGHFVALIDGRIWCPIDVVAVPWRDYLRANGGRACTLLQDVSA